MIKLKNILAENMLRFGPKNLSESDKIRLQQRLLSEAKLKDLDSAGMASAQKFFAAEYAKGTNGPQFATANLIYVADTSDKPDQRMKYNINIFKLISINYGISQFIIPAFYGMLDYTTNYGLTDGGDLELGIDPSMASEKTLQAAADSINFFYEEITPETLTTHFNGQKAKLATAIATTKAAQNFAALGPLLKGSAKTAYDLIAAS
jgi:hypothetical protein